MGTLTNIVVGLSIAVASAYAGYEYGKDDCASSNIQ